VILGVVTAIAVGYVGPVRGYIAQRAELERERAALLGLEERRDRLAARLRALDQPAVLEARARELGLIRPHERPFLVRGLGQRRPPTSGEGGDPDPGGAGAG
jgi:hypothetical protein